MTPWTKALLWCQPQKWTYIFPPGQCQQVALLRASVLVFDNQRTFWSQTFLIKATNVWLKALTQALTPPREDRITRPFLCKSIWCQEGLSSFPVEAINEELVSIWYYSPWLGILGSTAKQVMNSQGRMCADMGRMRAIRDPSFSNWNSILCH